MQAPRPRLVTWGIVLACALAGAASSQPPATPDYALTLTFARDGAVQSRIELGVLEGHLHVLTRIHDDRNIHLLV